MRGRLALGAALVAVTAAFSAVPASAAFGGECDGTIDVNCHYVVCVPGDCVIFLCPVWVSGRCL